ncbi:DUF6084 family protein [Streptosporangium soli]|nr:DUF6084 family protein [Streptosporangium sp. KLBMP 9127]
MTTSQTPPGTACQPILRISVEGVETQEFAATPTLAFRLRIDDIGGAAIRSVALNTHIRIDAADRTYDDAGQKRLAELFGAPAEWGRNLRSLLWTQTVTQIPAFTGGTTAIIPVGCTYDFEVAAAKYLHGLREGEVPLDFLFSGTIFYQEDDRLRAVRIPWDTEAVFRMPVRAWKDTMAHYFPNTAWVRLSHEAFDRLYAYKTHHTLATWDDAVHALLRADGG